MEITKLSELLALPPGSVVLDEQGSAWQLDQYAVGDWFAPGAEIERTTAQMLEIGPLRLIHTPGPASASTVDVATAILALQSEIQVYTCRSCNGHGTQAMVLEPYNTLPCLRCHSEGVTHEVPPGRYETVLLALLDALGGATVDQITVRLAPLLDTLNPKEGN